MFNKTHRPRCRYYDNQGYPRGPGCFRTAAECAFVHPDDPEWDEPPPSHSKPQAGRGRAGYRDEPRTRSRNASRRGNDHDSNFRARRERSRSRSRSSIASTHRSSQSVESNKRMNIDSPDQATTSTKPLDLASRLSDAPIQHNFGNTTTATTAPERPLSSSNVVSASSTLTKVPPSAPPPIPMPIPTVLPTASSKAPSPHHQPRQPSSSPSDAISDQDKLQLWSNRIRLLADAIKVQEQIADCEDRIALAEQTQQTSIFDSLTSTQKTRHQQELANLTAQLQADTEALDTIIGKLAALSDGWPKKPSHSQEVEAEIENQYQDITRYVQDLKATADKMQAGLNEISEATSKEGVEEKEPEPSEMELALDRLVVLESKLGTVANEYISRDRDIKEEISYKLATSMDKLRRSTLRNIMKDDPAILAKERVEADINGTREQVEILSNEIADLVTRLDNMNVELTNSRQANYEWKEVYERELARLQAYENLHNQDIRVIQTLQAALNAYTSKPMSPPPSPVMPGPEFVMDQIQDPLFEEMRSTVQDYVSNARAQLIELINEHNTGVYQTLWEKLEPTLRIINKITERLNEGDMKGVHTLMTDAITHQS